MMRQRHGLQNLIHFVSLLAGIGGGLAWFFLLFLRSRSSLAAENLFLRKQLAFYQERKIGPRRLTDAARLSLVSGPDYSTGERRW